MVRILSNMEEQQRVPSPVHRRHLPPRRLGALLLVVLGVAGCAATKPSPPPQTDSAPPAPASGGPLAGEDFTRLRTQYGERDDFSRLCELGRSERLRDASQRAEEDDWQGVLAIAEPWVKACPVDIDARYVTAAALLKLERKQEADEQIRWYRGLVRSVLASGDGQAPETAYVVISVPEEYAVLRALELRSSKQALLDGGIDAMTVESDSGSATVYFNPAAHLRRLHKQFGDGDADAAPADDGKP